MIPVLLLIAWIHCLLLASLLGWALRRFEGDRTFLRQQVWRATLIAVAALHAPAVADALFGRRAWLYWNVALQVPMWTRAAGLVVRYALCFSVHWIVFRTCLYDASGVPLSGRSSLWIAGLSTLLVLVMELFGLALLVLVLTTIRGP